MARVHQAIVGAIGLVLAGLLLTGCAAIRDFVAQAPIDLPSPSLPALAEPFEKIYQGGSEPEGAGDEKWATKSQRRIVAIGALHNVFVYSVDHEDGSNAITVKVKGDPEDAQLLSDVETYVVPVALAWSPTVTVIIDPSLCGIAGEVRDDTPLCDAIQNR